MTAAEDYPQLRAHNPHGTRLRTLVVTLPPGDSLLPSTAIVPVDPLHVEIVGGDFSVEMLDMALIAAADNGDIWGINFKLRGGLLRVNETPYPLIRLRPRLASQPDEDAYDQSFRVPIRHT